MSSGGEAWLDLHGWSLSRRIGDEDLPILQDIDFTLRSGEWVGLLGANGSGKTSLLRWLGGEESALTVPAALVVQDPDETIVATTVRSEVQLGRPDFDVTALLEEYGLADFANLDPRLLSAGQKQRLAVAVALAGEPRVLLCDEPTGLQDAEQTRWVRERLLGWRDETDGALVVATQSREEAALADRLVVLEAGRLVEDGPAADVLAGEPARLLLGGDLPVRDVSAPERGDRPTATWRGLSMNFGAGAGFAGIDLELLPGDRIGLVGPNGCGKSSLLAAATGLRAPDDGECRLGGRRLYAGAGGQDLDHGLALLAPQFPEYFFSRGTVAEEVTLDGALAGVGVEGLLTAASLSLDCAERNPHALSSGERRRLAVAMVAMSGRPLLLFDEPTAGQDFAGRRLLHAMISAVPDEAAVVIASHDHDFLRACCGRIVELGPTGLKERE